MNINYRFVIPALAAVALTASAAIAQLPGSAAPSRDRTLPIAQDRGARMAQFCDDIHAREAARFTFIEERLKLTAAQKPLFERWKGAMQSVAAPRQANCGKARPAAGARTRPTLPERNTRMEEMLKTRLANLETTRGPQEALYNALSDDQKKLFQGGDGRGRFGLHRASFRHGPMGRGGHGFQRPGFGSRGFDGQGPGRPGFDRGANPPPT